MKTLCLSEKGVFAFRDDVLGRGTSAFLAEFCVPFENFRLECQ